MSNPFQGVLEADHTAGSTTAKKSGDNNTNKNPSALGMPVHWTIRSCNGLHGPAVFLNEQDARHFLSQDDKAVCRRFRSIEDVGNFIHKKRKRKSSASNDTSSEKDGSASKVVQEMIRKNDETWEETYQELKAFTTTIGDGDPNLATGKEYKRPKLQSWITTQRREYNRYLNGEVNEGRCHFDRKERFFKLLQLGLRLKPEETTSSWRAMAQKWRDFTMEHPFVPLVINARDPVVVELAQWQQEQIEHYVKMMRKEGPHEMYPHRVKQLKEWGFPFPRDIAAPKKTLKTFEERLQEFITWKEENGSAMVPQSLDGLGEWTKEMRKEYRKRESGKKTCLSEERLRKLEEAGFIFRCRTPRKSKQMDLAIANTVDVAEMPAMANDTGNV